MNTFISSLSRRVRPQRSQRILVVLTVALSVFMAIDLPLSLHGFGVLPVLVLVALDVVLINSTDGVAFVRSRSLDERQHALRDRAYRLGFRVLGLAFVLLLVVSILVTALSAYYNQGPTGPVSAQLNSGVSGRTLVAIIELLVIVPTLVIAWMDTPPGGEEAAVFRSASYRRRRYWRAAWLALPVVAVIWICVVVATPVQTAVVSANFTQGFEMAGASCRHFVDGRIVGAEFGATVGLRAEVCWNHTDAFVVGDPLFPLPKSALESALAGLGPPGASPPPVASLAPDELNPTQPSLTECGGDSSGDFAMLSSVQCTASIDALGTLRYTVHAHVSPLPFSLGARDIAMSLVIDRNGRILSEP